MHISLIHYTSLTRSLVLGGPYTVLQHPLPPHPPPTHRHTVLLVLISNAEFAPGDFSFYRHIIVQTYQ